MVSALAEAVADVVDRTDRAEVTDLADLEDVVDRGDVAAPPPLVDDAKALLALLVAVPDVDDRTDRDEVVDRGDVGVVDNPFFGEAALLTAFFSTSSSFCCGDDESEDSLDDGGDNNKSSISAPLSVFDNVACTTLIISSSVVGTIPFLFLFLGEDDDDDLVDDDALGEDLFFGDDLGDDDLGTLFFGDSFKDTGTLDDTLIGNEGAVVPMNLLLAYCNPNESFSSLLLLSSIFLSSLSLAPPNADVLDLGDDEDDETADASTIPPSDFDFFFSSVCNNG